MCGWVGVRGVCVQVGGCEGLYARVLGVDVKGVCMCVEVGVRGVCVCVEAGVRGVCVCVR